MSRDVVVTSIQRLLAHKRGRKAQALPLITRGRPNRVEIDESFQPKIQTSFACFGPERIWRRSNPSSIGFRVLRVHIKRRSGSTVR